MTREIVFFKSHSENKVWGLVPDLFVFLKKALREVKASVQLLSFNIV